MAYKSRYETETVGDTQSLDIGSVNATQYKRTKDNNTNKSIKDDRRRYRINEKIHIDGKKFQLNGTVTEIIK